ncbi:hypothetical protein MHB40_14525 [Lysinibacillus sp. FSL K6-0057]|uniref:hypothetical protein n=1 Tax=Lysinibacillus sp. FSL K6-0057 TaxID=2921411 RepID=UPI003159BBC3
MNNTIKFKEGKAMFPVAPQDRQLECPYCGKHPDQIEEYLEASKEENSTPIEYVKLNENTYCQYTGCFVCTTCYVNIGSPTLDKIHSAFPYFRMDVEPLDGQNSEALVKYRLGEL